MNREWSHSARTTRCSKNWHSMMYKNPLKFHLVLFTYNFQQYLNFAPSLDLRKGQSSSNKIVEIEQMTLCITTFRNIRIYEKLFIYNWKRNKWKTFASETPHPPYVQWMNGYNNGWQTNMYAFLTSQRVDFGNSLFFDAKLHIANVFEIKIGMGDEWMKKVKYVLGKVFQANIPYK